jgi:Cu(I)/Ag(I) efflux system membrane fusion protein
MKTSRIAAGIAGIALVAAIGFGAYEWGMSAGMKMAPSAPAAVTPAPERTVLYWHDPMVPNARFDKPGKSPYMDMDLVPVYAQEAASGDSIAISPQVEQNLGIRTVAATKAPLAQAIQAVGSVAYNERELELVQARAAGFIEHLYVRAPLDRVKKGEPLVQLLVPDWVAAQEEFLAVSRMSEEGLGTLREAARQRMRLAGMSDEQIALVAKTGEVHARMTIASSLSGVVTELAAREGMTVAMGAPLFRINGLDTVWVNAEVPESASAAVRPGAEVDARSTAWPGRVFKGKVGALLPQVSATTRTITARIELANPRGELTPGMFVTVDLRPSTRGEVVQVPTEAVISTGKRNLVIVATAGKDGGSRFEPVEVETGVEANGMTEIRRGIEAGTKVVASGQFLLDAEASLKGAIERLGGAK